MGDLFGPHGSIERMAVDEDEGFLGGGWAEVVVGEGDAADIFCRHGDAICSANFAQTQGPIKEQI